MDIDIKLKLLAGDDIYVDDKIKNIPQIKLKEIKDIGYIKYCQYLNFFIMNISDIFKNVDLSEINSIDGEVKLNLFDYIVLSNDNSLLNIFIESINFFCKTDAKYSDGVILLDSKDRFLYRENYELLCKMIKIMNGIEVDDIEEEKYLNEEARLRAEKMKKCREMVKKCKDNDGQDKSDFSDLISSICAKSNKYGYDNIFDLTIYQFYDLFKRLCAVDNYSTNIQAIIQGAKDIKLNHWSCTINNN